MLNYLQDMIRYDPLRKVKYGKIRRALHIRPTAATYGASVFLVVVFLELYLACTNVSPATTYRQPPMFFVFWTVENQVY